MGTLVAGPLPWAVSLFLTFCIFKFLVRPALISPLARIPNAHWSAPFSRLWILGVRFFRHENRTLHAAHRRLGPVIRIGPHELSVSDMESVRTIYQGGFEKPSWYSVFDNYGTPCMFSARAAAEHSARKRLISHVYSKSYIQSSSAARDQAAAIVRGRFLPILERSTTGSQQSRGIDAYSLFMAATMDFITAYIWGLDNGTNFLDNARYREHFMELYRVRNGYGFYDQEMPAFTRFCRGLGIPFCPSWVDSANEELRNWCWGHCERTAAAHAVEGMTKRSEDEPVVWKALAGGLKKEAETRGLKSILYETALRNTGLSIASELLDHVLAGQETAGLTLTYLAWRLTKVPALQADLRAELLTLEPSLRFDGGAEDVRDMRMPDARQLDSLPLLHAVLMETLRLHAPIPGPQPRETPRAGCRIGGFMVPGGVRVAASAYTLHRDEEVFSDPERWDYTRWLPVEDGDGEEDEEDDQRKKRNRQFWAFSSGGRMCVGSNFALHEMKMLIAAIYSNYTSHIVDDDGVASQSDGYTGRPAKERLFLRFDKVVV